MMANRNYFLTSSIMSALALVVLIGCLGCWNRSTRPVETAHALVEAKGASGVLRALAAAPASPELSHLLETSFIAGVIMILIGAVTAAAGQRTGGGIIIAIGVLLLLLGTLLHQYPWIVLVFSCFYGLVGLYHGNQYLSAQRQIAIDKAGVSVLTEVVQNTPAGEEIKQTIRAKGPEAAAAVDAIVDPIKEELRAEGKIA